MISCNRIYHSVSFVDDDVVVEELWKLLVDFLRSHEALPHKFSFSQIAGHPENLRSEKDLLLTPDEIERLICARALTGFHVDTGHTQKSVAYSGGASLTCRIESRAKAPSDWSGLIEATMNRFPSVGGWQIYWPYRTWQTLGSTSNFGSTWGELPPNYRTWHEPNLLGIGPGRTMLDISLNPGRTKQLAPGVTFFPTAEMWLGPHFWQYAKCTKEQALAADFFIEKRDNPHFLYLKCWHQAFSRPDGEQGRMQQRLWKLFFHEDCEWPPGSGTICDEPMFGPPELMPGYQPKDS